MKKILVTILLLLLIPSVTHGDVINIAGAEPGSGSLGDARASGGTVDFLESSIVESGTYSFQTNPTGSGTGWFRIGTWSAAGAASDVNIATSSVCASFYAGTLPATGSEEIYNVFNGGAAVKFSARITPAGQIVVYDKDLNPLATTTATLSAGSWYRLKLTVPNGTGGTYSMSVGTRSGGTYTNIETLTGTGNFLANNTALIDFGKKTNRNGNSVDYYWDNIVIDDLDCPLGTEVVMKQIPNANGTTMQWTAGTGASDWQEVDDVPPDNDSSYVKSTGTAGDVALFNVVDTADAGISGTIYAVRGGAAVRDEGTVSSFTLRLRSGATDSDTSSSDLSTGYVNRQKMQNTDPNTGLAWTTAALDAVQIGGVDNNTSAAIRMTTAGINVLFSPAVASAPASRDTGIIFFDSD